MNKLGIFAYAMTVAVVSFAAVGDPIKKRTMTMTQEQMNELARARLEYSGGTLDFPGKGHVAILNSQKAVSEAAINAQIDVLRTFTRGVAVRLGSAPFELKTAGAVARKDGAAAAVFIVDDPALPMSLVSMEDGWGVVNVAALKQGAVDRDKLVFRFRKEFLRVTALTFGCARSQYRNSVFQKVTAPEDLDGLKGEDYTVDALMAMIQNLKDIGVTPTESITYREACEDGRAPSPTNDIQKAVWDEVHKIPAKPLKIEFDPKTDK